MALVLFVVVGISGFRDQLRAHESADLSLHTLETLNQATLVLVGLVDAETGQRGYLLTGDTRYLEPYDAALSQIGTYLARMRELTSSDPWDQDRITTLDALAAAKLDELRGTIDHRRRGDLEGALGIVRTNEGKATMDRIRRTIDDLGGHERALLGERLSARAELIARTRKTSALASLLGAFLVVASMFSVNRQALRRLDAERAAHEERQRLDVTLRSIGDAVITVDTDNHVVFMNPIAERITGWPLSDARGRPLAEVFHIVNEETRAEVEDPLVKVMREGIVAGLANHTALIMRDGRETPIEDCGAPVMDVDGTCVGAVLVFHDAAAQRRAERERLAHAEATLAEARKHEAAREELLRTAEAANRAKDEFLAILSHELRSPLLAMLGWVTLLKKGALTVGKSTHAIEIIERNINLQTRLVEDILDVSRIVSGKLAIEHQLFDVAAAVRAAVDDARPSAETKGMELVSSVDHAPTLMIGDDKRLRQVVGNLLANAVKFTPSGGRVQITLASREGEASIEVADTGAGITPDFLPRVFDRFQQADASKTRSHRGLGLGLSIARSLAELHGGRIEVRSEGLGKGATFTVRLPVCAAPPDVPEMRQEPPPPPTQTELAGMAVMIVDDEDDTREVLGHALEQSGARVYPCSSVAEALRVVDQVSLDAIVSDIGMPGESGYQLVEKVRARLGSKIAVIALSGFASPEDRAIAMKSGFDDHVAKPVSPDALVIKLRQVVRPD